MKNELIRLEKISKIYGTGESELEAVSAIDLTIYQGEFVAIMGASGSGKSTLMHLLGALDRPTTGKYLFKGINVADWSEKKLADFRGREIGFVFQSFNLIPRVSALKNVELPMMYQKIGTSKRQERARELLTSFGLEKRLKHRPNELSGGEKQRVAMARALINNAPVILADEPTGNLDSKRTKEIMEILAGLNRNGKTIIMVTHEQDLAKYATRLIEMKDGHIVVDKQMGNPIKNIVKKIAGK